MNASEPGSATATVEEPKRRRWKRWTALGLVLAIGFGVWMASGESETIRKARHLRIGMTKAEVEAVMGPAAVSMRFPPRSKRRPVHPFLSSHVTLVEGQSFATRAEQWQLAAHRQISVAMIKLGFRNWIATPNYPVSVSYDDAGVARFIRRGSEVVRQ
jgi:hypothetical protein